MIGSVASPAALAWVAVGAGSAGTVRTRTCCLTLAGAGVDAGAEGLAAGAVTGGAAQSAPVSAPAEVAPGHGEPVVSAAADAAPSVEQVVPVPLEPDAVAVSADAVEASVDAVSADAAPAEAQAAAGSEAAGGLESLEDVAGAEASALVVVDAVCAPESELAPSEAGVQVEDVLESQAGVDVPSVLAAVESSEAADVAVESVDVVEAAGSEGALVSVDAGVVAVGAGDAEAVVVDVSDAAPVAAASVAELSVAGADVVVSADASAVVCVAVEEAWADEIPSARNAAAAASNTTAGRAALSRRPGRPGMPESPQRLSGFRTLPRSLPCSPTPSNVTRQRDHTPSGGALPIRSPTSLPDRRNRATPRPASTRPGSCR